MKEKLEILVLEALGVLGVEADNVVIERPADMTHGDYSTNAALVYAKVAGVSSRELAGKLVEKILETPSEQIKEIEIAGPGFINFRLSDEYLAQALSDALGQGQQWGSNEVLKDKKVIVEYTDPNPFKEFHIGHLMSNTIGESIARIIEASGAETKRVCYQGDVGMHVAKAVWYLLKSSPKDGSGTTVWNTTSALGHAYKEGDFAYRNSENEKSEITEVNKQIYSIDLSEEDHTSAYSTEFWYRRGRQVSLDYFETIYKKLGTKFDEKFFESTTEKFGKKVVLENRAIFPDGENGAIVYKGDEEKGLHTRVFINALGIPTYEAKELGLAQLKNEWFKYDTSIVITGNEVNAYFKVILDAMSKVFPDLAKKTIHISHGMLRLPTGKMSSRTGDVITAEYLIDITKKKVLEKISKDNFSPSEQKELAEKVAIGAIKYSILRQASGKDIVFDFEQSLSFEGDSGPYLQYTYARTRSLLEKAGNKKIDALRAHEGTNTLHKLLLRFPEIVIRANEEREPHYIATYLIELAREFNSFYAHTVILDDSMDEPYKLALVKVVSQTMKNGLNLLGIPTPERM
ncbi:MAG: arginine--tRNA ligase [Minisyncoccia bacterium]